MRVNTNRWNQIRYSVYAPIYDLIANVFHAQRKKSIALLNIQPKEKVLIVGAGTGLDLPLIPDDCELTVTDLTPAMLEILEKRSRELQKTVTVLTMDGQKLEFADNSFDKIILHLILAVIPDPVACLRESARVCKPGGSIVVFDKFVPLGQKAGIGRKILNVLTNIAATNITRDFDAINKDIGLTIEHQETAGLNGNFRIILLQKAERF